MLKIINGRILTPQRIIEGGSLYIRQGKIEAIVEGDISVPGKVKIINAEGLYVSPGFIDIHVHGGGGADFMDGTVEAFLQVAETHIRYGTTAMVPTTLTSDKEQLLHTLATYEKTRAHNHKGAQLLGMHLEGPYFAMNQRGAQDPRYIRDPDPAEYLEILQQASLISRWSAAPERNGALSFGDALRSHGVLAAIAHTDAVYDDVLKAIEHGYTLATHLYSGMSGVTRRNAFRYAGVVESALLLDEIDVEIIADGVHLPEALLKLIYKTKGASKIALITDAMRAAGTAVKTSMLGHKETGLPVIIEDGVAKLPDRSSFAGSIATTNQLVRTMITTAGVPLLETIGMMSTTPARIMGLHNSKGALTNGKDADVVIFDDQINVAYTIIAGEVRWRL
ncbi:N-acetylglucosamine-6-phosphate deacetylase [Olivibacter ginsenosidimutans]|uniref:N-acetylglucosamine-6-phosphate deacetylase n=1 Tax=Olivibacter ginsenosidimutans TaxID=1176537 RepID=A0ABP9B788_9SPHI